MNPFIPPPLEEGRVKQVLVEYHGDRSADFSCRGLASGASYRFSNQPHNRFKWVYAGDDERFMLLEDFTVHGDRRIDPEADRQRAIERELAELRERVADALSPRASTASTIARNRGGRPPVPIDQVLEMWHLKAHCEWRYREIAERFAVVGSNPEGAVSQRLQRLKAEGAPDEAVCRPCQRGWLPPRPEKSNKT